MGTAPKRVFVSRTSELQRYPAGGSFVAAATEAINTAGHSVTDMDNFPAGESPPAEYCRQKIKDSDVYVGIIGFKYGSLVPDDEKRRSYVELEFDAADEERLPRLVFLLDDQAAPSPLPPIALTEDDQEKRERQQAFRERIRKGLRAKKVDSPEALKTQLLLALTNLPESSAVEPSADQEPTPGLVIALIPLAGLAQQRLQAALTLLQRAGEALDQVERRGVIPDAMDRYDYAVQAAFYEQLVASIKDPAEELASYSQQARTEIARAGDYVTRLGVPRFAEHPGQLAPIVERVAELERTSAELLARAAQSQSDLQRQTTIFPDFAIPGAGLSKAHADLDVACRAARSMQEGLNRPRTASASAPAPAAPAAGASDQEDVALFSAHWAGAAETRNIPPGGKAAAGPSTMATDVDARSATIPGDYIHSPNLVAVKVKGDSMSDDGLQDGDYVIVDHDEDVTDGDIGVVRRDGPGEDTEALVKRVWSERPGHYRLKSSKPHVPDVVLTPQDNPVVEGKVIGMFRPLL
jgi:SOS-response transcriptional repressor LexA